MCKPSDAPRGRIPAGTGGDNGAIAAAARPRRPTLGAKPADPGYSNVDRANAAKITIYWQGYRGGVVAKSGISLPRTEMSAGDSRRRWEAAYGAKPSTELSWFQDRPAVSLDLIEATGFGPAARIVDVGAGASRLAEHLLEAGYERLTVLDIAPGALAEARARLGPRADKVEWIEADVTAWRPAQAFEIWHDRATFHFLIAAEQRRAYRAALEAALLPGGQAIIATFAPDGPQRCSGLPVMRYGPADIARELGAAFTLLESRAEDHHTPGGAIQKFRYFRLTRR